MAEKAALSSSIAANPLVGRERELATLRDALANTLAGRGSLVLISGVAGIGKTALAETLCAEASKDGALVLEGRCYDLSETPPYGPWAEVLARAQRGGDAPLPPDLATGAGVASQAALFGAVQGYMAALAARRPLVVLLDDLHWADPASLDLLRHLGRDVGHLPLLLLATYRADELNRQHPLYARLPVLVREARAERLDLRPLDEAAFVALVATRYAPPPDDASRLVAYLCAQAGGNPFYAGELLRSLEEGGTLRREEGGWVLGDLAELRVPPFLRQVIDARVDRLGEQARAILEAAAVVGQEIPLTRWASVAATEEETLLDLIERAATARVLEPTPEGARFVHPLIREVLYEGTSPLRRRAWHRQAGETVAAQAHPDPDAAAYHFRHAGDARAADWLVRAAERAEHAYAWLTAGERYEAALALLDDANADAGRRALLLIHLAQLRRYVDPRQCVAYLERAVPLASEAGDATLAAAALFDQGQMRYLSGGLTRGLAQMTEALPALEALCSAERARLPALAILGIPPTEHEHYHRGLLVQALALAGRFAETRAASEQAGRRTSGRSERELGGLALADAMLGEPERARHTYAAAIEAERAAEQHREVGTYLYFELALVALPYLSDQPAERWRLATEAEDAWTRARGAQSELPRVLALPVLYLDGAWAEARELALAALGSARGTWFVGVRHALGPLARAQGDSARAWRCVSEVLPSGPATQPGEMTLMSTLPVQRLAIALALDAGDLTTARTWLDAHDHWLTWSGAVLGLAEGQLGWATYHRVAGDPTRAREHAERGLAHASEPRQPLALLAAYRLLGELDTATGQHADDTHLAAALALAEACAAPYERALTLLALAERRAASGAPDGARAALDEAQALLGPLEARPALARAAALAARLTLAAGPPPAAPDGLSPRELDVLRLLASGGSNKVIAAALGMSVRTLERHIANVYNKIDAASRAEAIAFAHRQGLS